MAFTLSIPSSTSSHHPSAHLPQSPTVVHIHEFSFLLLLSSSILQSPPSHSCLPAFYEEKTLFKTTTSLSQLTKAVVISLIYYQTYNQTFLIVSKMRVGLFKFVFRKAQALLLVLLSFRPLSDCYFIAAPLPPFHAMGAAEELVIDL